jgi:N-acetylneuraminate synthase
MVGDGHPAYVIAEIGINHNGDMDIVKGMIDAAVHAGADAVKFQKRTPEVCTPPEQQKQMRETPWGYITYLDYRYKVEFNEEQYREIDRYAREKGIAWMASVWDEPSVDFLEKFDTPAYKVPSASLTDLPLLKYVRKTGKPMIISTGMSTMEQIHKAVDVIGTENLIIMHCTSTGRLSTLLYVHLQPINQVVSLVPSGGSNPQGWFILRWSASYKNADSPSKKEISSLLASKKKINLLKFNF